MAQEGQQANPPQQQRNQPQQKPGAELQRPASTATTRRTERPDWSNPFGMMRRLMEQMDDLFSNFGIGRFESFGWAPAMETLERDGKIVLRVELPDTSPENVNVEVIEDQLFISAEHRDKDRYGSFERSLTLPDDVDPSTIEAQFENSVLEVSFKAPEPEKSRARKIDIKTTKEPESVH